MPAPYPQDSEAPAMPVPYPLDLEAADVGAQQLGLRL